MTRQLALSGLAEFVFHLTRLDSEMFQIARNSGCLTQTFYKFEINSEGTVVVVVCLFVCLFTVLIFPSLGALDANRPVPFRLTPNLQSFLSPIGINGPLYMSIYSSQC